MSQEPNIVDELERRLIATYYDRAARPAARRVRTGWVPAAGSLTALAAIAAIVVLVLLPGGVNPPTAQAALDRAADAVTKTAAPVLGAGTVWTARVIQTSVFSQPLPQNTASQAPRTISSKRRAVSDIQITQSGRLTDRTVASESAVDPADAARYAQLFSGTQVNTTTTVGHGKLASPLLPTQPLLSYQALLALPDHVSRLRQVISRLLDEVYPQQTSASTSTYGTPSPASTATTSRTTTATVTTVGSCCGTSLADRHAVLSLTMISSLLALPVGPAVRAALYHTAATLPGVRYDGPARDALGREGVAISVGSGDDQLKMIFNERTGALLATSVGLGASAIRAGIGPLTLTLQSATVTGANHAASR